MTATITRIAIWDVWTPRCPMCNTPASQHLHGSVTEDEEGGLLATVPHKFICVCGHKWRINPTVRKW